MKQRVGLAILVGTIGLIILGFVVYNELYVEMVMQQNRKYVYDYMQQYIEDTCTSVEKQVYVPATDIFGMGGHYEAVNDDSFNESYQEIYHMEYQGFPYDIIFEHSKRGKMSCIKNERANLVYIIDSYEGNYKLIENVALEDGCKATLLSKFNDTGNRDGLKTHFILLYVPDIDTAEYLLSDIYDKVTGGYIEERRAKLVGDDINMPRYIITNDEVTYNKIANLKEEAKEYLYDYEYECFNSRAITDKVMLSNLLSYLIDLRHPNRFEAQMINTEQYIRSDKWLLTYELEYGIAYYLNVYDLDKE